MNNLKKVNQYLIINIENLELILHEICELADDVRDLMASVDRRIIRADNNKDLDEIDF